MQWRRLASELTRRVSPAAAVPILSFVTVFWLYKKFYNMVDVDEVDLRGLALVVDRDVAVNLQDMINRLEWGLSGLVLSLAWLVVVIVTMAIMWTSMAKRPAQRNALILVSLVLAVLAIGDSLEHNPLTLPPVEPTLLGYFDLAGIEDGRFLLHFFMGLIFSASVLMAIAAAAVVAEVDGPDPEALRRQRDRLKLVLYVGALVLVAGVIQVRTMHHLPALFLREHGESFVAANQALAMVTGTLWTLLLLGIYYPAARVLHMRILGLAQTKAEKEKKDVHTWLEEHGLHVKPLQLMLNLAAVLGPFITGSQAVEILKIFTG